MQTDLGAFLLARASGSRPAPLERTYSLATAGVQAAPLELEQTMPTVTPLF